MKDIIYNGNPNIFDSSSIPITFHSMQEGLQIKNSEGAKGKISVPWTAINNWIDELWDIYDSRSNIRSKVLDEKYSSSPSGLHIGSKLYISWGNLLKFTDELWEIWDARNECA